MKLKPTRVIEYLRPRQPVRLGDAVAAVAQPIAKAADTVFGTDLQHCGGCAERQRRLNELGARIAREDS